MHCVKVRGTSDEVISVCQTEPEQKEKGDLPRHPPERKRPKQARRVAWGLKLHGEATPGARALTGPGTIVG
jgi:hypothetical protein